jgi:hypothetical protein
MNFITEIPFQAPTKGRHALQAGPNSSSPVPSRATHVNKFLILLTLQLLVLINVETRDQRLQFGGGYECAQEANPRGEMRYTLCLPSLSQSRSR